MSTFDLRYVQNSKHRAKAALAMQGIEGVLRGAARIDAANGDFMAAMGAVVPSLMEQLRKLDAKGQEGPTSMEPQFTREDFASSIMSAGPRRSLFRPRATAGVAIGQLGLRVAQLTAKLAGRYSRIVDEEDPNFETAQAAQDILRRMGTWMTEEDDGTVTVDFQPEATQRFEQLEHLRGQASSAFRRLREIASLVPDNVITPASSAPPSRENMRPGDVIEGEDGSLTYMSEDGVVFEFGPGTLKSEEDRVLEGLLELQTIRRAGNTGIDPEGLGAVYIDVWGMDETSPMTRVIDRHIRTHYDIDELRKEAATVGTKDSTLGQEDRRLFTQGEQAAKRAIEHHENVDELRGTMTAMEFIESLDELGTTELIQFQHALWQAGYYGNTFNVLDGEEPPWGERGNAFWSAVGMLVEDVAGHDNSWSVERWLAERASFVEDLKARGSGGGRGGRGGGAPVVVRLSDPEAIKEAGNRFAQEEIGFELSPEDHADLVSFVHGLERELAGMLQTGGEVTEIDVAARIRAWIAERYPQARSANRMNDAWAALRAFIMQGAG